MKNKVKKLMTGPNLSAFNRSVFVGRMNQSDHESSGLGSFNDNVFGPNICEMNNNNATFDIMEIGRAHV